MTASREQSSQSFEFDREATVCFASRRFFLGSERDVPPSDNAVFQLHSSLNGGSLPHGGMDGLMAPAPPLDADTPLDAAPPLDDTPRDP